MPLPQKKLIPGIFLMLVIAALASPPLWWGTGNPPVIDPAAAQNNHGPANIGQAKHMAKSALDALRPILPAVADQIEADLAPIVDLTIPPDPKPADWADKQKAPLLIGQLKAIADPFYTRLNAAVPAWLAAERTANGTNQPGSIFPWTSATTDDSNKSLANIGQLKAVFSLRFDTIVTFDADGDGIPDIWEIDQGYDPYDPTDADEDGDGDGLTNEQEYEAGRDPNTADEWGPRNADFKDVLRNGENMTFRPEYPSDLYPEENVIAWDANEGGHIEIWQEDDDTTPEVPHDGDRYIELQSHLGAHGVKQEFPMLSESRMTFILRYKGRYEDEKPDPYHNAFELKVEGAAKLIVNGTEVNEDNGARTRSFTDTEKWQAWQYACVTIIAPEDEAGFSYVTFSLAPDETLNGGEDITHGGFVSSLPVKVVEVSPKVKDENGNDIEGSEKPNQGKKLTPFVEVDPHANKIAHRELKVKIGEALKGKKVTWTLEELPGTTPATIRGEWSDSPIAAHKNAFEESVTYGTNAFKISGVGKDAKGETTVGDDGHTAIRVNVPPIGFNQVRIKIEIEGIVTAIDLIDMEVPGVVVIDPGHGGVDSGAEGRTDKTVKEKDLALAYSLKLREELIAKFKKEERGLRIVMTRKTTGEYMENSARANLARDKGADVFISIHFNSGASSARGTETLVRGTSNVNEPEDTTLATLFLASTLAAVQSQDAAAINRGVKNYAWSQSQEKNVPSQWAVLSDSGYGNTNDYHPIRGSIVEVEFLSHETALETVRLSNATGAAIKTKFAADVSTDIYNNILNQP